MTGPRAAGGRTVRRRPADPFPVDRVYAAASSVAGRYRVRLCSSRPYRALARRRRRLTLLGAALLALLPLAGGCGIRGTTVPVDAGPAPTRVSCQVPKVRDSPNLGDAALMRVYLVCGGQVTPVQRVVPVRRQVAGRLAQVRELVAQLQRSVLGEEAKAGFDTRVPGTLEVLGPRQGDPQDALRLSERLTDLPSFALAEIVCTLADSPYASAGRSVVLGGSAANAEVRRYTCTPELRTRPQAADSAGVKVPS